LGIKREMQKPSFFVIPGVREWLVVEPSQDSVPERAKVGGGIIYAIAEAEEEVFQCGLFVSPVTGETKNVGKSING
jgi:hypothetical protein